MMNRSREQIIANILSAVNTPIKRTHIMYHANLSFDQLKIYMDYLHNKKLIQQTEDDLWEITDAGRAFVGQYQLLAAMLA
jgi:predicted transcriptional regulator